MFCSGDVCAWPEPARIFDTHPEAATVNPPIFKKWRRVIMVSLLKPASASFGGLMFCRAVLSEISAISPE
jgi:hypothetical protein